MKAKNRLRFDVDVLRELAGAKVFARGAACHRDGQVEILAVDPERVLAQVAGTEDYRTEVREDGDEIDGECSCPAWEDWGFCKHMVATALAANDLSADEADSSGALARKPANSTEITAVCVHPSHRGRGYGQILLAAISRQISARGEIPFLHVFSDNSSAIALYRRQGMEIRRRLYVTVLQKRM